MKLTVSSRLPAVLKANEPWPRSGAVRKPVAGCGATEPGISRPRSTKWRPFSGISCTVSLVDHLPTEVVTLSIAGVSPTTATSSVRPPTCQAHVLHRGLRDFDPDVLHHRDLEAPALDLQAVAPDRKRRHQVLALMVADRRALGARRLVAHADLRSGHDRALIVDDATPQARRRLRGRGGGDGQNHGGGDGGRPPRIAAAHETCLPLRTAALGER